MVISNEVFSSSSEIITSYEILGVLVKHMNILFIMVNCNYRKCSFELVSNADVGYYLNIVWVN